MAFLCQPAEFNLEKGSANARTKQNRYRQAIWSKFLAKWHSSVWNWDNIRLSTELCTMNNAEKTIGPCSSSMHEIFQGYIGCYPLSGSFANGPTVVAGDRPNVHQIGYWTCCYAMYKSCFWHVKFRTHFALVRIRLRSVNACIIDDVVVGEAHPAAVAAIVICVRIVRKNRNTSYNHATYRNSR